MAASQVMGTERSQKKHVTSPPIRSLISDAAFRTGITDKHCFHSLQVSLDSLAQCIPGSLIIDVGLSTDMLFMWVPLYYCSIVFIE